MSVCKQTQIEKTTSDSQPTNDKNHDHGNDVDENVSVQNHFTEL